jgi:3-oxoacyl-[acyl-carrier protein] reductase
MRRFDGRTVLITGAAQGLGYGMAELFAREGANLALCDRNEVIKDVAGELTAGGRIQVLPTVADVADPEQVNRWITDSLHTFGSVDVLVNNAGVIRDNRLENMSEQDWELVVDVSLRGAFHCCRAVFGPMKRQRYGRVLSLSSMSWRGNFGQVNYAAAKAGIVGLARTVALEGAPFGITSNAIAPGLIDTPMLASMNGPARAKLAGRIPLNRIGRPADIAEAAGFLCSEGAGYITGVVLDVDGGIGIGSALR